MSGRILSQITIAFIFGILSACYMNLIFLFLCVVIHIIQGSILTKIHGKKVLTTLVIHVIVCLIALVVGYFHCKVQKQLIKQNETISNNYQELTVLGEIVQKESREQKESKKQQQIYHLKHTQIYLNSQIYPSNTILIYSDENSYSIGNTVQVTGKIISFKEARNEGNFDEKKYNISKNIGFKLEAENMIVVGTKHNKYRIFLSTFRERLSYVYQTVLTEKEAGFFLAAVLGKKSFLDPEMKILYQQAGISHILAISGLHVSMIGMGIFHIIMKLTNHLKAAGTTSAVIVIGFAMMSGMETATTRAAIMFLIMIFGKITGFSYDTISALCASALIQLWQNPFYLFNTGFLFSYVAVLGVVIISPILRSKWENKLTNNLTTSLSIQLCILPLSLYYYYELSIYSILINTLVLPFMGIILFFGILGGLVGLFSLQFAAFLLFPGIGLLKLYDIICNAFLKLPGAVWITGKPHIICVIIYYSLLILIVSLIFISQKKIISLFFIIPIFFILWIRKPPAFEITFLDVGQGDGIFVQTGKGHSFFLDGGSSDVSSVGTYRILPFLKSRGIKKIDGWFVSHGDSDHTSGLLEILESEYPIETIILSSGIVKDEVYEELRAKAEKAGSQVLFLNEKESIVSGDMKFTCLYPNEKHSSLDRNESSMVLLLTYADITALFTGDIGEDEEAELLREVQLDTVTIYKGAHHGSAYSNSEEFMSVIQPEITVISCGAKNRYGHPSPLAVQRILDTGSKLYETRNNGQIKIYINEKENQLKTMLMK